MFISLCFSLVNLIKVKFIIITEYTPLYTLLKSLTYSSSLLPETTVIIQKTECSQASLEFTVS